MNFFVRHRKTLARYGGPPATGLLFLAACFVFFHPAQISPYSYLDYFFSSPLGMALELIVVLVMLSYLAYHLLVPVTPKHRGYFVAAALFLGLVADGIYIQRLSRTIDFLSSSGASQFFACAVIFYCLYRLVLLVPDRERKWVTIFLAAMLSFHLIHGGMEVHKKLAVDSPCMSGVTPDLWHVIIYKNPDCPLTGNPLK